MINFISNYRQNNVIEYTGVVLRRLQSMQFEITKILRYNEVRFNELTVKENCYVFRC